MTTRCNTVGIVYHGKLDVARQFSAELEAFVRQTIGASVWRVAAAQEQDMKRQSHGTDLVLAVGGDGTLLRTARGIAGSGVSLVGINLGRLGFMTELTADQAFEKLPRLFAGEGWTDARAMLSADVNGGSHRVEALNDIVLGRGCDCRIIRVEAMVNGSLLASYRADGVIVATATGSTSYALAAGGPILYPQSTDLLLLPISAHLSFSHCLVLPAGAIIELKATTESQATLSADGQVDIPINNADRVIVRRSDNVVKFRRLNPPEHFYESLTQRLKGEPLH